MNARKVSAVHTAILSALDLDEVFAAGVDPQEIVDAVKGGHLHRPLTEFFTGRKWQVGSGVVLPPVDVVGEISNHTSHVHNPSIPLIGHDVTDGSSLFRSEEGLITYWNRDSDLDRWFSPQDTATPASTTRTLTTTKMMKLREMAACVTGCTENSLGALSRAIVDQQLDITRTQWNALIRATEGGEDYLPTNTYGSFAFAKTGKTKTDKNGEYLEVVVLYAYRCSGREWDASVYQLYSVDDWDAGGRLVLRNGSLVS